MTKLKNTVQKGAVRYIVFRDGNTWYAVGLEFNIVVEADTPETALFRLFEALRGYVKSFKSLKARPFILNQKPDQKYEELWWKLQENTLTESPYQIHSFGTQVVSS